MILILTNAQDVTADFFEARLAEAGVPWARLNTERMAKLPFTFRVGGTATPARTTAATPTGAIGVDGRRVALDDVSAVYFRRPILPELPPDLPPGHAAWIESELRRAWGGFLAARPDLRWVNHPLAISGASYKPEQLARAARFGLRVPETLVTNDPAEAETFCRRWVWEVVTKPVGHGEVLADDEANDRIAYTNRVPEALAPTFARVAACPTLFQQALAKHVDLRVTITGREAIAVALHSQERPVSAVDCRRANMEGMRYSLTILPDDLTRRLVDFVGSYGLLYAAIDLVRDPDGGFWFLELNPAGQWAWLEQLADAPISAALIRCLRGAA
jgi:glutathione synthase/RimK-type ligase-like ATP-grasp enzyme